MATWDDEEKVELLTTMWGDGFSGSQIGARIGVSRNAVIGKAYRLGLPKRASTKRIYQGPSKAKRRRDRQLLLTERQKSLIALRCEAKPIPPQVVSIGRKSLLDLEDHDCRWPCRNLEPNSTEQQMFCGEKKMPGLSYCEPHAARAFDTSVSRKLLRRSDGCYFIRSAVQAPWDRTKAIDELATLDQAATA